MLLTIIAFILRIAFLAFTAVVAYSKSLEEREFYNDVLEKVQAKKYHELASINSWTVGFPRIAIEAIFLALVLIPLLFTWNFISVIMYVVAVAFVYKNRVGRLFSTSDVFKLTVIRVVFILLTFISII